jgi:hypothetical protein
LISEKFERGKGKTVPLNGISTLTTGIRNVLILNLYCGEGKGSDELSRS